MLWLWYFQIEKQGLECEQSLFYDVCLLSNLSLNAWMMQSLNIQGF